MRYYSSCLILAGVPSVAFALEKEGGDFSPIASFFQMIASLALVVGIIYIFYYASNRWLKKGLGVKGRSRLINVVETCYISPKKSFLLVEVCGEHLLISNCGDGLRYIKQVDIPETERQQTAMHGKEADHGMFGLSATN